MHTAHCARHIQLCVKCNQPVPKREFEAHICHDVVEEKKAPVTSIPDRPPRVKMNMPAPTKPIENVPVAAAATCHKPSILETLPTCKYCELEFPQAKLNDHEHYCGSRTEQCPECSDYVMLREWEKHQSMRLYHGNSFS